MTSILPTDALLVPGAVTLDGDHVCWRDSDTLSPRRMSAPRDLLDRFVRMHTGPDETIRRFAGRWGILGICGHNLPRTHSLSRLRIEAACRPIGLTITDEDWHGREPIASWREWSAHAHATLTLAAAAHHHGAIDRAAWDRLSRHPYDPYESRRSLRALMTRTVQTWLELAGIRPQFSWDAEAGVQITLGSRGTWESLPPKPSLLWSQHQGTTLFGTLTLQLLARVSQVDGLAICSACAGPYAPTRRPNPNRENYCPQCRKDGAALRNAKRRSRERLRRGERRRVGPTVRPTHQ